MNRGQQLEEKLREREAYCHYTITEPANGLDLHHQWLHGVKVLEIFFGNLMYGDIMKAHYIFELIKKAVNWLEEKEWQAYKNKKELE